MLIPILNVVGGFALLLICADLVVRGSVAIADRLNIPPIIVGLTIVAFGTSAPELFISAQAVLRGLPGVALGNVVGSNIANIFLVVGLPALLTPIIVNQPMIRRNLSMMLTATAVTIWIGYTGEFTFYHGLGLFLALIVYLIYTARRALKLGAENPLLAELTEFEELTPPKSINVAIFYTILGLIGLPVGAHFLVEGSVVIAHIVGVPEAVISITLIAFGTSLPELATAIAGAFRKQSDVILGNIIGSNLFNILGVLGISAMIGNIKVADQFLRMDFWVMAAAALALAPFIYGRRNFGRLWGLIFIAIYCGYVFVLFNGVSY